MVIFGRITFLEVLGSSRVLFASFSHVLDGGQPDPLWNPEPAAPSAKRRVLFASFSRVLFASLSRVLFPSIDGFLSAVFGKYISIFMSLLAVIYIEVEHDATVKNVTELQFTQSKTSAMLAACMVNMHQLSKSLQVYVENAEKKGEALDIEIDTLKRDAEKRAYLMDLKIKYMEKKLELLTSKIDGGGSSSCDGAAV